MNPVTTALGVLALLATIVIVTAAMTVGMAVGDRGVTPDPDPAVPVWTVP